MVYHCIFDKVSIIAFYNEVYLRVPTVSLDCSPLSVSTDFRYDPASSKNEPQGVGVFFLCKFKKMYVLFFERRPQLFIIGSRNLKKKKKLFAFTQRGSWELKQYIRRYSLHRFFSLIPTIDCTINLISPLQENWAAFLMCRHSNMLIIL